MIYVAVAVLAVLAIVAVLAAVRRRQSDAAIGMLSRETRSRDRSSVVLRAEAPPTGREVEKAAAAARAERLVLTHLAPGCDPAAQLAEAVEVFDGDVDVARPGLVLTV